MLGKDKLIYDATTTSDGDSIAAFLHATLKLTSTTIGADEALDVNIVGSSGLGIYAEDAAHASGDIGTFILGVRQDTLAASVSVDGDYGAIKFDALGRLWANAQVAGDVADDAADSGNPIKVGQRAVSGALTAVSATNDRADQISDLFRRQWVNTAPNIAGSNAAVTVDDTAGGVALFASPLAGRRRVIVQNLGNKEIFLGFGTVTTANGTRVAAGATWTDELGPDLALKAVAGTGDSENVRVLQVA